MPFAENMQEHFCRIMSVKSDSTGLKGKRIQLARSMPLVFAVIRNGIAFPGIFRNHHRVISGL
jgi:hypothetical protein